MKKYKLIRTRYFSEDLEELEQQKKMQKAMGYLGAASAVGGLGLTGFGLYNSAKDGKHKKELVKAAYKGAVDGQVKAANMIKSNGGAVMSYNAPSSQVGGAGMSFTSTSTAPKPPANTPKLNMLQKAGDWIKGNKLKAGLGALAAAGAAYGAKKLYDNNFKGGVFKFKLQDGTVEERRGEGRARRYAESLRQKGIRFQMTK